MVKERDRPYSLTKSLTKKLVTAGIVIAGVASSVLNSGCSGKLYLPAGKCPNLKDRTCTFTEDIYEDRPCCIPIAIYACGGCKDTKYEDTEGR
jgi:hypothetical protein